MLIGGFALEVTGFSLKTEKVTGTFITEIEKVHQLKSGKSNLVKTCKDVMDEMPCVAVSTRP